MAATVFIDGEAGTTGLQIRERLGARSDVRLLSLPEERRKDIVARKHALNSADAVVLCLPDEAAIEAVGMIENPAVKVIDASTAFRVDPAWVYGFPELRKGQREAIRNATRISNPGCYPTGFLALAAPLVAAGLIPKDWPLTCNAVSGYSGGGKSMIAEFEDPLSASFTEAPYRIYAMPLLHKHVPEMQTHAELTHRPLFAPAVGRYYKGMIVEVPLQLEALPGRPRLSKIHETLCDHFAGERFVEVANLAEAGAIKTLEPQGLNGTNRLKLFVFGAPESGQARLVALLDNLGKGASGAAVQNLNLALGLEEGAGL
jgi:N-acetyl-gamma-glutamyl-phosphate reductase